MTLLNKQIEKKKENIYIYIYMLHCDLYIIMRLVYTHSGYSCLSKMNASIAYRL